jgi:hypothetical protein
VLRAYLEGRLSRVGHVVVRRVSAPLGEHLDGACQVGVAELRAPWLPLSISLRCGCCAAVPPLRWPLSFEAGWRTPKKIPRCCRSLPAAQLLARRCCCCCRCGGAGARARGKGLAPGGCSCGTGPRRGQEDVFCGSCCGRRAQAACAFRCHARQLRRIGRPAGGRPRGKR